MTVFTRLVSIVGFGYRRGCGALCTYDYELWRYDYEYKQTEFLFTQVSMWSREALNLFMVNFKEWQNDRD